MFSLILYGNDKIINTLYHTITLRFSTPLILSLSSSCSFSSYRPVDLYTHLLMHHVRQKTAPFIFARALSKLYLLRQFSACIYFSKFTITHCVPDSLCNRKRRTSLSFESTAGQYNVHARFTACTLQHLPTKCSFVGRC